MLFPEEMLQQWTSPLSASEEQRVENTVKMIKEALRSDSRFNEIEFEVFAQGSYANNTNIKKNSDVDICVMCTSTFFPCYEPGLENEDYGFVDGTIAYSEFRSLVVDALKAKFGAYAVQEGNKCVDIAANSYHVNADVVPAFMYRDYKIIHSKDSNRFIEGIKFFSKDDEEVINYPKMHIENGINKNKETNHRYKKLVRIMKMVRSIMVNNKIIDGDCITSFLVECLVWNVPNSIICGYSTWTDTLKAAILFLWDAIDKNEHKEWGEVSEILYLFHSGRKWTDSLTKEFLDIMYDYLEF